MMSNILAFYQLKEQILRLWTRLLSTEDGLYERAEQAFDHYSY